MRAMDALVFMLVAAVLVALGARWPAAALVAVPVAALAGTTLPDLDLALGLGHRSGLTHGLLVPVLFTAKRGWWPVAAGAMLGVGLHLAADCFPNAMRGYATVKLPGAGSIGAGWSYLWLGVNAAAALAIGGWLVRRQVGTRATLLVLAAVAAVGIGYLAVTDGGWPALLVFAGSGWVLIRRRGRAAGG